LKIAAAVLAAGVAVWTVRHFSEPSYQGKLLSVWLDEAARRGDTRWLDIMESRGRDSQPAQAILAIGRRGLPLLLSLLRAKETPLRKKLRDFAQTHKWIPINRREPNELHALALYGFWVLGPAAKSAVPELIAALEDDDAQVRAVAAYALSLVGPADIAALPALEKRLMALSQTPPSPGDWQAELRCVLHAVGEMGPPAWSALPQITQLSQQSSQVTVLATAARIKITGKGLDSAIEPLKNPSAIADWRAAYQVAFELGTNAAPAVPLLVTNLQYTNMEVQFDALAALIRIHARPDLCGPAIAQFLSSSDDFTLLEVLVVLSAFGPAATQWVSTSQITPCLTNHHEWIRVEATNALRRLYPEAAAKLNVK
jgi:HEAT repeat protein